MRPAPGLFLLLLLGATPPSPGLDAPTIPVGPSDIAFEQSSPLSADSELKRRVAATNEPPPFDIAKEKFRVVIPKDYTRDTAWGLFVWVDASPVPNVPPDWVWALAAKKLLFVAAYDTGNERNSFDRCRLAVDSVHNMKSRFHVDPDRVYVSGVSGGGRLASMLGVAYADVFTGCFPMVGVNFYKSVPTGEPRMAWLPKYRPDPRVLESAKAKNRYVLLTGEKDFNRENTTRIFRDGFEAEGFRNVLLIDVPGMGHGRPSAEWLLKGIEFLDRGSRPR